MIDKRYCRAPFTLTAAAAMLATLYVLVRLPQSPTRRTSPVRNVNKQQQFQGPAQASISADSQTM